MFTAGRGDEVPVIDEAVSSLEKDLCVHGVEEGPERAGRLPRFSTHEKNKLGLPMNIKQASSVSKGEEGLDIRGVKDETPRTCRPLVDIQGRWEHQAHSRSLPRRLPGELGEQHEGVVRASSSQSLPDSGPVDGKNNVAYAVHSLEATAVVVVRAPDVATFE